MKYGRYTFLLFLLLSGNAVYCQQHLLPVKAVINAADFSFRKPMEDNKWNILEQGCYYNVKKGGLKLDCNAGQRFLLQASSLEFNPAGNYTIEFKIKVPYISNNGRGFDISVYDGLKAFDFNITDKQLTDYGIKKVLIDSTDFGSKFRTVRFAVERFVGIVHIYIDGKLLTSYIMRKPTKEKYLKIGKGQSASASAIEISSFCADFTGAYRPD